jgi:hypothetical protein
MKDDTIKTFDDVLHEFDLIIDWAKEHNSRIGYFAAVYQNVTRRVKAAANAGEFQDRNRMEQLDVLFANRYFVAF